MKLSKFGQKFTADSATVSLMDDLGQALTVNPDLLFMGGGNPADIPAAEAVFREALEGVTANDRHLHKMLGVYQSPQGDPETLRALAAYLRKEFDWPVTERNIALCNGSQSGFAVLFNLFAGDYADGSCRQIQLPLVPEYVGYADVGFSQDFFVANKPALEEIDAHTFKYHVDFDHFSVSPSAGAFCVSRPTNPTGNVLTDDEVEKLAAAAAAHDIPLILDGAYGAPFPNIVFSEAKPFWNEQTILVLSLSKLGLPGARTGIIVAREEVIQAFAKANTILSLACGNLGPAILGELIRRDQLNTVSNDIVRPYYREAARRAEQCARTALADLPYAIHKPEGAFFLWLWFKDLPITSRELYQRLKQKGVLVLAGEDFFVGLNEDWRHRYECIRVTYCQSPQVVEKGMEIIAEEVRAVYTA